MQKRVNILHGQSVLDVAVQEFGTIESVMDIAIKNGISITDTIAPGTELIMPNSTNVNKEVAAYYKKHQLTPSTALLPKGLINALLTEDGEALTDENGNFILI